MFFIFKKFLKTRLHGYNLTLFNNINGLHGYNLVTIGYNWLQFPNKGWGKWYYVYIHTYPIFYTIGRL